MSQHGSPAAIDVADLETGDGSSGAIVLQHGVPGDAPVGTSNPLHSVLDQGYQTAEPSSDARSDAGSAVGHRYAAPTPSWTRVLALATLSGAVSASTAYAIWYAATKKEQNPSRVWEMPVVVGGAFLTGFGAAVGVGAYMRHRSAHSTMSAALGSSLVHAEGGSDVSRRLRVESMAAGSGSHGQYVAPSAPASPSFTAQGAFGPGLPGSGVVTQTQDAVAGVPGPGGQ